MDSVALLPWRLRPPGSPTAANEPEALQNDTEPIVIYGGFSDWVARLNAATMLGEFRQTAFALSQRWVDATDLSGESWHLQHENALLRQRLAALESRLSRLEAFAPEVKVVVVREITKEQAKQEIRQLFASGDVIDYEAIVDRLRLDLRLVVDICNELIEEEEIGPDE